MKIDRFTHPRKQISSLHSKTNALLSLTYVVISVEPTRPPMSKLRDPGKVRLGENPLKKWLKED